MDENRIIFYKIKTEIQLYCREKKVILDLNKNIIIFEL